ncbi:hypothetical protein B0A50_00204 [Salinomyces thailandicus]|uniref:Uncharacterized protein n=1 Tax=Salinomyces thailandicus TaxID=706561 RepID=A0A4U0UFJ7_9PEZI|nr:hypothetical protein B0A50_00204 [Salinomyces thailandica]
MSSRTVILDRIAEAKKRFSESKRSKGAPYDAAVRELLRPEYVGITFNDVHVSEIIGTMKCTKDDTEEYDQRLERVRQGVEDRPISTAARSMKKHQTNVRAYVDLLAAKVFLAGARKELKLPGDEPSDHPVLHRRQFEEWVNDPETSYLEETEDEPRRPRDEDESGQSDQDTNDLSIPTSDSESDFHPSSSSDASHISVRGRNATYTAPSLIVRLSIPRAALAAL